MKPVMPNRLKAFLLKGIKTWHRRANKAVNLVILGCALGFCIAIPGYAVSNLHSDYDRFRAGQEISAMTDMELRALPASRVADYYERFSNLGSSQGWLDSRLSTELRSLLNKGTGLTLNDRAVERLMTNSTLTKEFRDYYAPQRKAFLDWAKNAPLIKEASTAWPELSKDERFGYLEKIVEEHSRIFGFKPTDIGSFDKAPKRVEVEECNIVTFTIKQGVYIFRDNVIGININANASFDDFYEVFSTLIHENTHAHDHQLAKMVATSKIGPEDPRYHQGVIFLADKFTRPVGNAAYHFVPTERHGFWTNILMSGTLPELAMKPEDKPAGIDMPPIPAAGEKKKTKGDTPHWLCPNGPLQADENNEKPNQQKRLDIHDHAHEAIGLSR